MTVLRKLRDAWMAFVHVLGKVQTTILLAIIYHVAIGPIALIGKLLRKDLLQLRPSHQPTYAVPLAKISSTTELAQRQF